MLKMAKIAYRVQYRQVLTTSYKFQSYKISFINYSSEHYTHLTKLNPSYIPVAVFPIK